MRRFTLDIAAGGRTLATVIAPRYQPASWHVEFPRGLLDRGGLIRRLTNPGRKAAHWSSGGRAMARSALKRHPPRIGDSDADHFYNRAARTRDDLSQRCCEAFVDEACEHGAIESMCEDEQVLCDAVRNAREQRQRTALFFAEAWFSWRRRHTCRTN
jgi:hypothetical protein